MTNYRELTIRVPEPDGDGECSEHCVFNIHSGDKSFAICSKNFGVISNDGSRTICKPGPGCPWYEKGGE